MLFFVEMLERSPADPQEYASMLRHRIYSIRYQKEFLEKGELYYAFRSEDGDRAILMYDVDTLERLDWIIKRDPQFSYTETIVTPVVSSKALVIEAEDFIGESILSKKEIDELDIPKRAIHDDATYWLAYKVVHPYSPLLSIEEQRDIDRRTILAQRGHYENLEFADHNPVGRPIGILIAEGEFENVKSHVESCAVFPDTTVEYTRLLSLTRAEIYSNSELIKMKRPHLTFLNNPLI